MSDKSRTLEASPTEASLERPFSELEAAGVVLTLWSEVLGETILLVPESYKPREGDPVSYTYEEARVLMEADPDSARGFHLFKKAIGTKLYREKGRRT